jgi:hypothetical protein
MKTITFFLTVLFSVYFNNSSFAQVTLAAGDIVILQYNSDGGDDELVFLPLVDLPANSIIYFSDGSWDSGTSGFGLATERGIKFTVNASGITAGTLIKLLNPTAALYELEPSSLGSLEFYELDGSVETGSSRELTLSTSGDQVLIFQTPDGVITSTITFIYGFNTRSANGYINGWQADANALSTANSIGTDSHLPPGLTALNSEQSNKTTATAFGISGLSGGHVDNWQYTGPFTAATRSDWLERIHTLDNWSSDDATVYSHTAIAGGASSVTVNSTLGTDNFEKETITVFPNPSSDYIHVLGIKDVTDYVIHNSNGTEISKGRLTNNEKIEIKHLASNSLYFLKLEGLKTIKFLKK